ncbi:MAG: hypothetical protein R3236_11705 [Phycisphaeraceae bacterium]|nr:hypothetical protein [Phycisphaeraceae bacterium]
MTRHRLAMILGAVCGLCGCVSNDTPPSARASGTKPPAAPPAVPVKSADTEAAKKLLTAARSEARSGRIGGALELLDRSIEADPTLIGAIQLRAKLRVLRGDHGGAADDYRKLTTLLAPSHNLLMRLGASLFFAGRFDASARAFDRANRLRPERAAHNWQRGISLYYAGRFKEGRKQFELHRTVNPHDVENAAWHYLCHAREKNPQAAADGLIPIDTERDPRVPMAQIYDLFAGRGTEQQVLDAARDADTKQAHNYAHLYLGLWHEAHGRTRHTAEHIQKAAETYSLDHYMGQVSKVHWQRLKKAGR